MGAGFMETKCYPKAKSRIYCTNMRKMAEVKCKIISMLLLTLLNNSYVQGRKSYSLILNFRAWEKISSHGKFAE